MIYLAIAETDNVPPTPMAFETVAELDNWFADNAPHAAYSVWEQDGLNIRLVRHAEYDSIALAIIAAALPKSIIN
jgi:hypothetical protein